MLSIKDALISYSIWLCYMQIFYTYLCTLYKPMCVHAHHTHTCMYMHTHLLTPEREPTQTKVTIVLKFKLVIQLVFIEVSNMSIRVTYRSRDDSNVAVSQKSPNQAWHQRSCNSGVLWFAATKKLGCSGILMDQPDFIFRLKAILIHGQNKFIPIFCKTCLSMTWNMTCSTP